MESIIEHVIPNFEELKQLRLVSKFWRDTLLTRWRRVAVLKIASTKKTLNVGGGIRSEEEIICLEQIGRFPFKRYKFVGFVIGEHFFDAKLISLIGEHCEYVHFENCIFLPTREKSVLLLVNEKLPNLVDVVFTRIQINEQIANEKGMNLCYISKIQSLDLLHSGSFVKHYHTELLKSKLELPKLESLSVCLRSYLWPLQYNIRPNEWNGNLEQFIEKLAGSLKVLRIFRAPITRVVPDPFGTFLSVDNNMSALTELYLHGTVVCSLNFLKFTPNLEKLCIDRECFDFRDMIHEILVSTDENFQTILMYKKHSTDLVWMTNITVGNIFCKNLRYFEIDYEFSVTSLKKLVRWLPMIKTLKTILNKTGIAIIVEYWPNLEELTCKYGSILQEDCFYNDYDDDRTIDKLKGKLYDLIL